MPSFIRNPKDFWSGVIFIIIGLAAILIGRDYSMGTAGRMGPAYFPTILGGILTIIGAVCLIRSMFGEHVALGQFAIKQAFLVLLSTVVFGFLVRTAGLPISIVLMVLIGGFASIKFRIAPYLLVGVGLAAFCVLVFVKLLGLPMPILGTWFGL